MNDAKSHADAWLKNIHRKVRELQDALANCLALPNIHEEQFSSKVWLNQKITTANQSLNSLKDMYASSLVPSKLQAVDNALNILKSRHHLSTTPQLLLKASEDLDELLSGSNQLVSFTEIFEAFREDEDLNSLVDEIIELIEKIIKEGDDKLNARINRELNSILSILKSRDSYTVFELSAWIDITSKFLFEIAAAHLAVPGLGSLLHESMKKLIDCKSKFMDIYKQSEKQSLTMLEIKTYTPEYIAELDSPDESRLNALNIECSNDDEHDSSKS
jgi:hypothetical protein